MHKFTIGADPEVFLLKNGEPINALDFVKGSKQEPVNIAIGIPGYTEHPDNVALEFGIPPTKTITAFTHAIDFALTNLQNRRPQFEIDTKSSRVFPPEQLQHPLSNLFGCEPDYNAWTLGQNEFEPHHNPGFRSAGGHVHVGVDNIIPAYFVRVLDLFLGVPSILMDTDNARRELYGKAGSFRPKPYGVEYRTLSNFWIFKNSHREWVFRGVKQAIDFYFLNRDAGEEIWSADSDVALAIQACINNQDMDAYGYLNSTYPSIVSRHK